MQTRELYVSLFAKKVETPEEFINQITDANHLFYAAAREYVAEILSRDTSWQWLSYRVDDFGNEVEKIVAKKVQKWLFRAILQVGKMPICNVESTIKWLFNRMISEYKNLFDERSRNYLNIAKSDNELKLQVLKKMEE
ncbi:hypothetical protein [Sulfurimonas sp.]|uniref:hypothetical protein n=1 Tax=Sulfurimonas sp. TaxID=2022749 RepID=UPI0025F905F2|nr:hypothetical protein [Sulfurimonas sp.]